VPDCIPDEMACANPEISALHTRAQKKVWLVGQPISYITGTKLPSNQQALALFVVIMRYYKAQYEKVQLM
jgi:hypothetical protein